MDWGKNTEGNAMKGIQEDVSIHTQTDIKHKDIFCGKCFALIQMNHVVKKTEKYECPECGEENVFKDTDRTRIVRFGRISRRTWRLFGTSNFSAFEDTV